MHKVGNRSEDIGKECSEGTGRNRPRDITIVCSEIVCVCVCVVCACVCV